MNEFLTQTFTTCLQNYLNAIMEMTYKKNLRACKFCPIKISNEREYLLDYAYMYVENL